MGVFSFLIPEWADPNPRWRRSGILKLKAQWLLKMIAKKDKDYDCRNAAIGKINSIRFLKKIKNKAHSSYIESRIYFLTHGKHKEYGFNNCMPSDEDPRLDFDSHRSPFDFK